MIKRAVSAVHGAIAAAIAWLISESNTVRTLLLYTALALAWLFPPITLVLVMDGRMERDTAEGLCIIYLIFGLVAIPSGIVMAVNCHTDGNDLQHIKESLPGLSLVVDDAQQKVDQFKTQPAADEKAANSAARRDAQQRLATSQQALVSAKQSVTVLEEAPHTTGSIVLRILLAVTGLLNLIFAALIYFLGYPLALLLPTRERA